MHDDSAWPPTSNARPFWERKRLEELSTEEWEALCDGCGKCCVHKLEDPDGEYAFTRAACRLLDTDTGLCRDYPHRHREVPDCITLTPPRVRSFGWLPRSCAYRRLDEGRGLAWWHPLVSGDPESVHWAGMSIRGRVVNERYLAHDVALEELIAEDLDDDID
ncbi:YcgN family cysteine cluster protein [Arhodomonas sp. SL1]|uniref:YcgN family cysteine cluster protein n=1 Tax=Arhodomonas sp. SL1 TaxID=3425691 RepID=UPI003F8820F3